MFRFIISIVTVACAALFMSGCAQTVYTAEQLGDMTPQERAALIVTQPQVNDIYVANVSKFSEFFGSNDAFALMRVAETHADYIIAVTESSAWSADAVEGSLKELDGDFSAIVWDPKEKIVIQVADLQGYLNDGSIVGARRLTAQDQETYLKPL